jgi:heavy metal translocating P-type ATPase
LTINVMMLSFALYSGFFTELSREAVSKISWPIVILGTAVFAYGGAPIHRRAVSGLLSGAPGMEALISLGATSALVYSYLNWLQGSIHLYFDTASMLITIVLIGKALEHRSKEDVLSQLDSFFALLPSKVRVCSEAFPRGRYVDASLLTAGDVFRVIEGENVPADGRIVSGQGRVDESSLTGEARPLEKQPGDMITSGTRVDSGSFKVKALAVGQRSMVGQLVAIMERALERKTGLEDVTDKVLRIFVPAIAGLALATGAVCLALGLDPRASFVRAITVLVISCPCALGVAIPLARVAGISLAGKMGVLVHDFSVFQRILGIQAVVFDKTGTLTKGRWELVDIVPLQGMTEEEILALASGLESHSPHYVAQALVQAAQDRGIVPYEVHSVEQQDNGISGCSGGAFLRIGSASFVGRASSHENDEPESSVSGGDSILSRVYMEVDGLPVAVFRFGDALRESSRSVVDRLQQQGLRLALVSGDSEQTTSSIGRALGIDACHGDMRPADKAAFVESLKKQGSCVAMLGDGVNDVPALASADVGIGVHNGWQIGREASSLTLMGNDPQQLFGFTKLAGRVSRTIRQNLVFTFIYNGVSIPIAMSGLLNPLVAVTAMMLSSLSVTGNTLLLSRRGARARSEPFPAAEVSTTLPST